MREILFRGKRIDNGKWVYGILCKTQHESEYNTSFDGSHNKQLGIFNVISIMEDNEDLDTHRVDPNTVGQYTGLKDKNGVMIYDGDIVCKAAILNPSTVVWRDKYACFAFEDWSFEDFCDSSNIKDVEIIGNIHDKED